MKQPLRDLTMEPAEPPKKRKSSEIRTSRQAVLLGRLGGWLMRLFCATLRLEIVDRAGLSRPGELTEPVVYCLWHDSIFVMPAAWRRCCGRHRRRAVVLTSASRDGASLAAAVGVFGIGAVRGSTSRRGVAALVAMRKALKDGQDVCITPDGPRGPARVLQPGIAKLAETSGAPVIPIRVHFASAWRLKSWDRFHIPRPFSKVRVTFDTTLAPPQNLSEDGFEAWRQSIEGVMNKAEEET